MNGAQKKATYDGRTDTVGEVLADHKDDFVNWRYFFEDQGPKHIELLDLEPAVEAIIEEYSAIVRKH